LHCGDQVNAIDQKTFAGLSLAEANAILRLCTGDFCRIEVTPATMLAALNVMLEPSQAQQSRGEEKRKQSFESSFGCFSSFNH
jgi:hypothetical protein